MTLCCVWGFKIFEKTPHRFTRQDISDWVLHIFEKTAQVLRLRSESGARHKPGRGPLQSLAQAALSVNLEGIARLMNRMSSLPKLFNYLFNLINCKSLRFIHDLILYVDKKVLGRFPMSPRRSVSLLLIILASVLLIGCSEDTAGLVQKIADLEKRLQKQEKDLKEFAGKFSPPKDFSADIQRIEDQQEKIQQTLKTKVEPVNNKLEEFRDWAQEAQKEREDVGKKLKGLEGSIAEFHKKVESEIRQSGKELPTMKKQVAAVSKTVEELSKGLADVHKEIQENNTKLINAVKKTLPKVKEAAVAELKDQITPLEKGLSNLKSGVETDRQALAAMKGQPQPQAQPAPPAESSKEVQAVNKRVKELEEILASQKAYLLEMGAKVHELELQLKRFN